nr:hypothetical protein [Tanacetum cinerariifolium]
DQFPPTDRSDLTHEEFADELPPSTTRVNLPIKDDHSPLLAYVVSSIPENLKTLAKGFYPPCLHILSFN